MAKRSATAQDFDSPWKDALHIYLRQFLAFFFPDIEADIDWQRGYEALDKEFQRIIRQAKLGKRLADKLFKVWLRDGAEYWLLVHIEVQSYYEKALPQRMLDYNIAVRRFYNQEVISLAVLGDDRADWRPTTYCYGRWGCRTEVTFRLAKLLDHASQMASLECSTNPIATVVLAHLQALETRNDPARRRRSKFQLVKGLYERNWSREEVRQLFRLIDWLMTLPEELEEDFRTEVFEYEKERSVEYITTIERHGFKKGLKEGLEKGREEGREEGREGVLELIELLLETKFNRSARTIVRKVRALKDLDELRGFARFLKNAQSLDDVRAYLEK